MATTTYNEAITSNYSASVTKKPFLSGFFTWCTEQQPNRLFWLGLALVSHGCILTPLTIMAVFTAGNSMLLFMLALVSMGLALVTNLAALPTKITIPVFILSFLIDLGIVISCVYIGFHPGDAF